jgi:hypothetical protein
MLTEIEDQELRQKNEFRFLIERQRALIDKVANLEDEVGELKEHLDKIGAFDRS